MNRRGFLKLLGMGAAVSTVTHFLPPIGGWHSDVIAHAGHAPNLGMVGHYEPDGGSFFRGSGVRGPRIWYCHPDYLPPLKKLMETDGKLLETTVVQNGGCGSGFQGMMKGDYIVADPWAPRDGKMRRYIDLDRILYPGGARA